MRVLVLGGYGLIGSAVVDALVDAGHAVIGLGRTIDAARRRRPDMEWRAADIAALSRPEDWTTLIQSADAVVNCAGALQDGPRDRVAAVQRDAVLALLSAAETVGIKRFVQISAVGARPSSTTLFMRTKGEADDALAASRLEWTILRPGLVLAPAAYGGTALLRGLASFPLVAPMLAADAPIQTVSIDEVADAVRAVLAGEVASRAAYDLVEDEPHPLRAVVAAWRAALGRPPAKPLSAPKWLGHALFRAGDLAGRLGWRPPMRSAALREIKAGVTGEPDEWRRAGGRPIRSLHETLRRLPSTVQERWFGRLFLLKPVIIITLSLFWIASGAIGLARLPQATEILAIRGTPDALAHAAALSGGVFDILLGAAVLFRATHVAAAWGMLMTTAVYMLGGVFLAPDLWLDPLGSMVKAIPAGMLALAALAIEEER